MLSIQERQLLLYFCERLADQMSAAGCNDMDQSVFATITAARMEDLKDRFDRWDRKANPEDYQVRKLEHIPDFLWFAYLTDKLRESL